MRPTSSRPRGADRHCGIHRQRHDVHARCYFARFPCNLPPPAATWRPNRQTGAREPDATAMNRRKAVRALGSLALGTVASAWGPRVLAQPVCTLTPEQIEGPFYLDQARIREDISEAKPGVPLRLVLHVVDASASCAPIPSAAVDVWHCDALGIYSGYEGAVIAPRHVEPVDDK